jgi:hypothetical protein
MEMQLMRGSLVTSTPADRNPGRAVVNFVGDVGMSAVDTIAQTTRFTSNILSLDPEAAFANIGQLVSRRSVDSMMVELVQHLPVVLEHDLHKRYRASSKSMIKEYLTDGNLDAHKAAAVFSYLLMSGGQSEAEADRIAEELKTTCETMRRGSGNKSSVRLGQELAGSLISAINSAPKPLPLIGNPLNARRRLAISKGFLHSVLQTQGVAYTRGTLQGTIESAADVGIRVTGLSDQILHGTIDNIFRNFGTRDCLENAKTNADLVKCVDQVSSNRNRIVGSALESLAPALSSGQLKIDYRNEQFEGVVNLGSHLSRSLSQNQSSLQGLRSAGRPEHLNQIVNEAVSNVTRDVGERIASAHLVARLGDGDEESSRRLGAWSQTLVNEFSKRIRLLEGGEDFVKQIESILGGHPELSENRILDTKIRRPFKDTLDQPEAKHALLGIFLEKTPLSLEAKEALMTSYLEALRSGRNPLSFSSTLPEGFQAFLNGFDSTVARVANVPPSQTTIAYLSDLIDPESVFLNRLVSDLGPAGSGLFRHYLNCKSGDPLCDSLLEPFSKYMDVIREATRGTVGTAFEDACRNRILQISNEMFIGIDSMERNVGKHPRDVILGLASRRSQESFDCLLSGLARAKGFPVGESNRLYQALDGSLAFSPEIREDIVQSLHAYVASSETGGVQQRQLLASSHALVKEVMRGYAHGHVNDFVNRGNSRVQRLLRSEANQRITTDVVNRLVANINFIDENTPLSLAEYGQKLAESPLRAGTEIERSMAAGLKKTLEEPATRRDFLSLALGLDRALESRPRGFLGPGLERRIVEAYQRADLSGAKPVFREGTNSGVASFLTSFDSAVRGLGDRREPDESVLMFMANVTKPESRVIEDLIGDQAKGLSDLVMSLISCREGSSELCRGCLGDKGNWIIVDPATGMTEVLANAPVGHVLHLLKTGLRPGLNALQSETCRAAIPALVENVTAHPKTHPGSSSVLQDPTIFLDALALPANQTALNCIVSNFADQKLLTPLRSAHVGTESMIRELFKHVGVPGDAGLFELSGERLFETLEKRNDNPELLRQKSDFLSKLKTGFRDDTSSNRHETVMAFQDLTRSLILGTMSDSDMAYAVSNGQSVPQSLRIWAEGNTLAQIALRCMDHHYQLGFLPGAMYAAEEGSRLVSSSLRPWIDAGPGGRGVRAPAATNAATAQSPISSATTSTAGLEACVSNVSSASGRPASHPAMPRLWVGSYTQTLAQFQALNRAEFSATLRPRARTQVLALASDYQTALNHLRSRSQIVGSPTGGVIDRSIERIGTATFELRHAGPEGLRVAKHMKEVLTFPAAEMLRHLDALRASPTTENRSKLRYFVTEHCPQVWDRWDLKSTRRPETLPEGRENEH